MRFLLLLVLLFVSGCARACEQRSLVAEESDEELAGPPGSAGVTCGSDRWSVKTGADQDAPLVDIAVTEPTTIAALRMLEAPGVSKASGRVAPTEWTVFVLRDVWLTAAKRERDSDVHLVLEDDEGASVIAEVPHPACVDAASPWRSVIAEVRSAVERELAIGQRAKRLHRRVSVRGVGFFNLPHGGSGQRGHAPNDIELHPVLGICFERGCTP